MLSHMPLKHYKWESPLYDAAHDSGTFLSLTIRTLRSRLTDLLGQISAYLPGLTDHSIRHIDNMRDLAELFLQDACLTPLEVYCLNVAFLLHDSCLNPELHREGVDGIRKSPVYRQLRIMAERNGAIAPGREYEIQEDAIFFATLRQVHAEQASTLLQRFAPTLIDNSALREHTSNICGPIAASHHWAIEQAREMIQKNQKFPATGELNNFRRPFFRCFFLLKDKKT